MLHLDAGRAFVIVTARGNRRRLSNALPAAKRRQRLIGQGRAIGGKFLMDSHEIAFALRQ